MVGLYSGEIARSCMEARSISTSRSSGGFGIYADGQSILVGTPFGISLAPEGGAHQSITTSIGLEPARLRRL